MAETILVVDDSEEVVQVCVSILTGAHFTVLQAHTGKNAIKVAAAHDGRIDLLLSGVNMPQMSGPDLGKKLKRVRPDMHVMFMSKLRRPDLFLLNYGWSFIGKPFLPPMLIETVRKTLDTPDQSPGEPQFAKAKDTGRPQKKFTRIKVRTNKTK